MIENIIVWIVVALLILLGIGLLSRHMRGGRPNERAIAAMADPARGTLLVTTVSVAVPEAVYQSARIAGVISAEGIEPTAVEFSGVIATRQWPTPGASLPVIVDRANPHKFEIAWNEVSSALAKAEAVAAAMRANRDDPSR